MIDYNNKDFIESIRLMANSEGGKKFISFLNGFADDEAALDSIDLRLNDAQIGSIYRSKRIARDIIKKAIDTISPNKGD